MNIIAIIVGVIFGYIVYLLLGSIAVPTPFPMIAGLLAFVLVAFGGGMNFQNWR